MLLCLQVCCVLATVTATKCLNQQQLLMSETQYLTFQKNEFTRPDFSNQQAIFVKRQVFLETNIVEHSGAKSGKKEAYQKIIDCFINLFKKWTNQEHHGYLIVSNKA